MYTVYIYMYIITILIITTITMIIITFIMIIIDSTDIYIYINKYRSKVAFNIEHMKPTAAKTPIPGGWSQCHRRGAVGGWL